MEPRLRYLIETTEASPQGGGVDLSVVYTDDPSGCFLFKYKNVRLSEDSEGVEVWFDCQPVYLGDSVTLLDSDVARLETTAKKVLCQIIKDVLLCDENGIDILTVLDSIAKGRPLDIESIMSHNKQSHPTEVL
jgi:hypothetical protein